MTPNSRKETAIGKPLSAHFKDQKMSEETILLRNTEESEVKSSQHTKSASFYYGDNLFQPL